MAARTELDSMPDFTPLASEDYIEVLVDSADFQAGSKNMPTYVFQYPAHDIIGYRVLEASVPFTWYVVNSGNNQFNFMRSGGSSYILITIPPGNYDNTTIVTTVIGLLNTADATTDFSGTCDKTTNYKFVFTNTTNDFVLDFSMSANCASLLGFASGSTYTSTSKSLTSVYTCNFTGAGNLFLKSNLGAGSFSSLITSTLGSANTEVIATVPVTVNPNSVINWQNPATQFFTVPEISINQIRLWFTQGANTTPLDFNGADYWVKLALVKRKKNAYAFVKDANNRPMKRTRHIKS